MVLLLTKFFLGIALIFLIGKILGNLIERLSKKKLNY